MASTKRYIQEGTTTLGTVAATDRLYIEGAGNTIDTNIDQSGLTSGLLAVYVARTMTRDIGSVSSPFKVDIDFSSGALAGIFQNLAGAGTAYVNPAGAASAITKFVQAGFGKCVIGGTGTVTDFVSEIGESDIGTGVTATNYYGNGGKGLLNDDGSVDPTIYKITGGSHELERGATTATFIGGFTMVDAGTNTFTTVNVQGDATVVWRESGTLTTLNLDAPGIDFDNLVRDLIITNLNIGGGSDVADTANKILNNELITVTNTTWLTVKGGNS